MGLGIMLGSATGSSLPSDDMRFHFVMANDGSNVGFFPNSSLDSVKDFVVYINGKAIDQAYNAISFKGGDDVIIQRKNKYIQYPLFSALSMDYIRSIVEPLPPMYNNDNIVYTLIQTFYNCKSLVHLPDSLVHNPKDYIELNGVFSGCTSIVSIPETLFYGFEKLKYFISVFLNCTGITHIPHKLFCFTNNVTDMKYMFSGTSIEEIPTGVFDNLKKLVYIDNTFNSCNNLYIVPDYLFYYNEKLKSVCSLFYSCKNLTTVPENIFCNSNIEDFSYCFAHSGLSIAPDILLAYATKATSYAGIFLRCKFIFLDSDIFAYSEYVTTVKEALLYANVGGIFNFYSNNIIDFSSFVNNSTMTSIPYNIVVPCPSTGPKTSYEAAQAALTAEQWKNVTISCHDEFYLPPFIDRPIIDIPIIDIPDSIILCNK